MIKKWGVFVLFIVFAANWVWAQPEIDYKNKVLLHLLQKSGMQDFSAVSELALADSIRDQYRVQGKYFAINPYVSTYKYIYIGRVNSCRAGGCSISVDLLHDGQSEYFDYLIFFDVDKTVQLVKIFNYQATHGQEICSKGWLKQFIGHKNKEHLEVNKNIDAISGATISVYAITIDVEMKTELLNKFLL